MTQRHEIEAWVNPSIWDDAAEAQRVIDAIESSGSDSEAEWVRIAAGPSAALLDAAARDHERIERDLAAAQDELRLALVAAVADGMTEVEAARRAGVARMTARKWLGK